MLYNKSISATAYIYNKGKILFHMHKKYNSWFPVGGHVEENEFPHEALIREVKEETGFNISIKRNEFCADIDLGTVERVPLPFCTCREGIGSNEEFFDFIFIAYTEQVQPAPQKGESKIFKWFSENEIKKCENMEKHIKNTALAIIAQENQ